MGDTGGEEEEYSSGTASAAPRTNSARPAESAREPSVGGGLDEGVDDEDFLDVRRDAV